MRGRKFDGLSAGGRWIRTSGTAARKPWISAAFRALRGSAGLLTVGRRLLAEAALALDDPLPDFVVRPEPIRPDGAGMGPSGAGGRPRQLPTVGQDG
jgi:hypothetical protein